jgi:hypothetical protein
MLKNEDLPDSKELDPEALKRVRGGVYTLSQGTLKQTLGPLPPPPTLPLTSNTSTSNTSMGLLTPVQNNQDVGDDGDSDTNDQNAVTVSPPTRRNPFSF